MGIIPHIHHMPYLPIQKQQQFLELQNVKHHTQRKHQVQKLLTSFTWPNNHLQIKIHMFKSIFLTKFFAFEKFALSIIFYNTISMVKSKQTK